MEAAGREIGCELAPGTAETSGSDAFQSALAALGFQPRLVQETPDRTTLSLGNCPYRDAAHENQPVVCTLHRGITLGLLDVIDPHAELTDFVPRDPDTAGCLIKLSRVGAGTTDE